MKKIFLSLALVFGMVATAAAQVNMGARVAGTMSTFKGDDSEDIDFWGVGFNAGVAAKYKLGEMLAVAPELGVDFRRVADDEVTFSFWVLEIPVMVRVNAMPNLYIEGGPTFGFILSNDTDYDVPELEGFDLDDAVEGMVDADDIGGSEEFRRRIARLPELENASGSAYTFWRLVQESMAAPENQGRDINWPAIEQRTITLAIGQYGQSPESVAAALCTFSPGACTPEEQEALRDEIRRLTPILRQQAAAARR